MNVIDLFAGPGGWDVAAHDLGIMPLGIEFDDAACATRAAAGLRTLQGDVGALDPEQVAIDHINALRRGDWEQAVKEGWGDPAKPPPDLDVADVWGLIASPPCQAFSMAGKGKGRAVIGQYRTAIEQMSAGQPIDWDAITSTDERGHLVLEPLRWALALKPRWIACEQVEPVLPLWEATAMALRQHGYQTWTGIVSAEQYGVPQTRKRAILLASLDGPVDRPRATHQRYIAPRVRDADDGMFEDLPERGRVVAPEDRHLLPWVSMAQALGWDGGAYRLARGDVVGRQLPEGEGRNIGGRDWTDGRPATTVNGDPRISEPGHHDSEVSGSQQKNAVRVTLAEALVLQSFPSDYPIQGTKTAAFSQIGNAVPPLLAWHILRSIPNITALIDGRRAA